MNLEDTADREQAETVDCPWCSARIGETCRRFDGSPVVNFPAHDERLRVAGVRHAPLDSREYRSGAKRRSEVRDAR